MKCQTILLKKFFGLKGAVHYEAIAMVIFSHVKISSFRAKAHLVFHWCLYNKDFYADTKNCSVLLKAEFDINGTNSLRAGRFVLFPLLNAQFIGEK